VPLVVSPTAITSFAPHRTRRASSPTSRSRASVSSDGDTRASTRPSGGDVPADKPKLNELKLLTVTPEELEKRNEELKKRFVEFFGA